MSNPSQNDAGRPDDDADQERAGAEIGMSDDGSTFEPEEDPEGHAD